MTSGSTRLWTETYGQSWKSLSLEDDAATKCRPTLSLAGRTVRALVRTAVSGSVRPSDRWRA